MDSLVSTEWLAKEIGASDLRIVDATKHLPDAQRNALEEYQEGHIPGAVFMHLDELVDVASPIDNTMPGAEKFSSRMQELGLGDGSRIILYDDSAIKSSARAWFMFKLFGAHNVAILDGGIAKWKAESRPLVSGVETLRKRHFTAWANCKKLRSKEQVLSLVDSSTPSEVIVDARGAPRFTGEESDIRPGIAAGHIPGSRNVPYRSLFNDDGTFKSLDELCSVFTRAGVNMNHPIITSCGSGMTACTATFALHLLGKNDVSLYDGSWSEWGADPDLPKATGPAA